MWFQAVRMTRVLFDINDEIACSAFHRRPRIATVNGVLTKFNTRYGIYGPVDEEALQYSIDNGFITIEKAKNKKYREQFLYITDKGHKIGESNTWLVWFYFIQFASKLGNPFVWPMIVAILVFYFGLN